MKNIVLVILYVEYSYKQQKGDSYVYFNIYGITTHFI